MSEAAATGRPPLAVAIMEFRTTAVGMAAADRVLKTAECPLFKGSTVCPGKFLLIFGGELAAVQEAYSQVEMTYQGELYDAFFLGHISPGLLVALTGCPPASLSFGQALGLIEAFTAAGALAGADVALKAAKVEVLEVRLAQGMTGKGLVYLCGEVSAVEIALEAAAEVVGKSGSLCATILLPAPHEAIWRSLAGLIAPGSLKFD